MSKLIATRFAPSPTGDLHIGSLRTALFAYLFARKNKGEFLLRIEDTDQARYQEGSVAIIFEALKWVGINYDNEDNIIFQSRRTAIYQKYADELIKKGHAYYCFCSAERLVKMRAEQTAKKMAPKYDRQCLQLSAEAIQRKLAAAEAHVIRMRIPAGETVFKDLICGQVKFNHNEIDDQILIKSDGFPTYHLANVVDDHETKITHVIRAEEWLPSTPKHIILYHAFGWPVPEFAHLSLILAPDKAKLSKRHGATSVLEFKKLGYLPEALVNYIALLGWNPGTEQEIFSFKELEEEFDFSKVHQAGAVFDREKLDWLNGHYIRQKNLDELTELCLPYLNPLLPESKSASGRLDEWTPTNVGGRGGGRYDYLKSIVGLEQERLKKLSEIGERTKYFFVKPEYQPELLIWKKSDAKTIKERLEFLKDYLSQIPGENWTRETVGEALVEKIKHKGYTNGEVLWPMRVALSGLDKSPSPFEIAEVLGKKETLARIKEAVNKL
ncbi:glutamate--tRNA ligase [Candidatus Kuenenbacteria bacterium CG_4_9_14_3_um_filter_39_14]|uniref:Glutamate--tRNA ligase n=1 Tax=Candidatus Kuenenbacteria bacterium CG_4_9_14_3_um_filter_39_14 TaxID=1974616 RepID=A0A2M7Z9U9_9BACT|nr:MAG: glutamate--tRNA ligase [Candidatus Kuenenbacteria bacterium CG_4_9_14_3_um_filter_39_14]